jgi:protein-S-isoprenylcysteine O-methyltransferase Ste14
MNTSAIFCNETLEPQSTPLYAAAVIAPLASARNSFAYRTRIWITGISLGIGLVLTALNRPLAARSWGEAVGVDVLGWLLLCAGAAIRVWASTYICARKSRDVVQTGPYSVCRNPLYWGTFLMVAAYPLLLKSPILALSMLPPILLYLFAVVPVEEMVMAHRHGAKYSAYCQTVSRWWPNFFGYVKGEPLDGQSIGFSRECSRLVWWLGFAIGFKVLFHFANSAWWMHPLHWW